MYTHTSSSFPQAFLTDHNIIWYGIHLRPIHISCPSCVPPQFHVHSQPTCCGRVVAEWEKERAFMLCKHCSPKPKHCCVTNTVQSQTEPTAAVLWTTMCAGVSLPPPQSSKGSIKFVVQNYFIPVGFFLSFIMRFIHSLTLSNKSPEMRKRNCD